MLATGWRPTRRGPDAGGEERVAAVGERTVQRRRADGAPRAVAGAGLSARQRRMALALAAGSAEHAGLVARLEQRRGGILLLPGGSVPLCDGEGYNHDMGVT